MESSDDVLRHVCSKIGLGQLSKTERDIIVTDKAVWCSTLDRERLNEVAAQYKGRCVSYCPYPLLVLFSEIQPDKKILLIVTKGPISSWVQEAKTLCNNEGYTVVTIKESEVTLKEVNRLAKIAELTIFDNTDDSHNYYPFVSAGTPFLLLNAQMTCSFVELLRICNAVELSSSANDVGEFINEFRNIQKYSSHIRRLLTESSRRLVDIIRWIKNGVTLTEEVDPLIDLQRMRKVILRPWVGLIYSESTSEVEEILSSSAVKTSMILCNRVLVTTENISNIISSLFGVSTVLIRPYIERHEESKFKISEWEANQKVALCSDKIIVTVLGSNSRREVDEVPRNCVVVTTSRRILMRCIERSIPVVTSRSREMTFLLGNNYSLYSDSLLPLDLVSVCSISAVVSAQKRIRAISFSGLEDYLSYACKF